MKSTSSIADFDLGAIKATLAGSSNSTPRTRKDVSLNGAIFMFGLEQKSPEWYNVRRKRITGSNAAKMMADPLTKTNKIAAGSKIFRTEEVESGTLQFGLSKGALSYASEIAASDFMTDSELNLESFTSYDMQWGIDTEPFARYEFETLMSIDFEEVGFVSVPNTVKGCSPDGVNMEIQKGCEIKCPKKETHFKYLKDIQELINEYFHQVQWCMYVTGFKSWYLMSFHPYFKKEVRLVYTEVDRCLDTFKKFDRKVKFMTEQIEYEINLIKKIQL